MMAVESRDEEIRYLLFLDQLGVSRSDKHQLDVPSRNTKGTMFNSSPCASSHMLAALS